MKTAQEFINTFQNEFRENGGGVVRQLMIAYAREAIKADRKNLLNHVELLYGEDEGQSTEIDKNSILNAPQIELL